MSVRRLAAATVLAASACLLSGGVALAQFKDAPIRQEQEQKVPSASQKQFPLSKQWTLVSLNGKPVTDNRPTLMIDEALRARGFGGCNTFSATAYPLAQQRFAVGPIALTRRSCEKDIMERERVYLVLLRTAAVWDVKDGQLLITGNNGQLKFDRAL